ncbi:hypothetical protein ACWDZ8_14260, partial [Streptomyces sp. NPDC003233]
MSVNRAAVAGVLVRPGFGRGVQLADAGASEDLDGPRARVRGERGKEVDAGDAGLAAQPGQFEGYDDLTELDWDAYRA